ncbi:MAG: hypothetical protein Fur0040_06160 [Sideroxydans sp.]
MLGAYPAPDLRGVTVLLPNMHVAQPLAQALMRQARLPALLLPEMVTLNAWAERVPLEAAIIPESQRSAMLYRQLRERRWFDSADLWQMTRELLKLFDELTWSLRSLPESEETFVAAVAAAYQARQNEALQLEARLVFELWHAMQQGAGLDGARAWQQRLARLAREAKRPLFVLRVSEWDAVEQRFLDIYAQHAPVTVFDLRLRKGDGEAAGYSPASPLRGEKQALSHKWERELLSFHLDGLGEREQVGSPRPFTGEGLGERVRFFAATSLEQEARAAAMQVRLWLDEGKRDIAIVAQDRVVARRMRALLERVGVLVADETGWTLATLSVATVLERWLTALQSDFYHHDLLDLLKSPFIFGDMMAAERKSAVYELERLLRQHNVVEGVDNFIALAQGKAGLYGLLARLREAAALLQPGRPRPLAEWQAALRASLDGLGITQGLLRDEAGQQLLRMLEMRQQELAADSGRYAFHEWRRWLAQQLDLETFRDSSIDSPVRFTHLAATRWRAFEAVLLLGCDAGHLPSVADGGSFFNDAVRAALGLPTRAFHAARQRDDLNALLALNPTVLVTWQKEQDGEARLLSPFLQLLRDGAAGGTDAEGLLAWLAAEDAHAVDLPQAARPAPTVPAEAVPQRLSISAYNALVACPYQFHARHILGLDELEEVEEDIEKRDYGERVHAILERFHERHPVLCDLAPDEAVQALRAVSEEAFAELVAHDFTARAWLARWLQVLPAYLDWQRKCEGEGWRVAEREQPIEQAFQWGTLRGRIDRLDVRDEERRVLDYKTQSEKTLRDKLKEPGEDVQLACYVLAKEAQQAAFVCLDKDEVKAVFPEQPVMELARLEALRLEGLMARMRNGAGLPANGIEKVCEYCEMRGLCRKGAW